MLQSAFPTPWCRSPPRGLAPRLNWVAARGTQRPAKNRALCACRWPPPWLGHWARSASYPFGAPRCGCRWRVPPASVLGCVRCGGWRVWTRSQTRPPSLLAGSGGPASWARCGAPHLFPWRVLLRSLFARPPPGWGRPFSLFVCSGCLRRSFSWGPCRPLLVVPPPPSPPFFFSFVRPRCLWRSVFSGPGCLGPWRLLVSPPLFFFLLLLAPFFFFPPPLAIFFWRPRCLLRSVFSGPGCLGPWRLLVSPPPFFPFFSSSPGFLFFVPVVSGVPCVPARGALGLGALLSPLLPPPCCFFLPVFFLLFFFFRPCLAGGKCGAGVCVLGCGVCWCVLRWCCSCRCSLCGALSPLWRWLVLCNVARRVGVFAVGPGCPPLPPGGS